MFFSNAISSQIIRKTFNKINWSTVTQTIEVQIQNETKNIFTEKIKTKDIIEEI